MKIRQMQMVNRVNPVTGLVLGTIILCVILCAMAAIVSSVSGSGDYVQTDGVITESYARQEKTQSRASYCPEIRFRYQVNAESYEGNTYAALIACGGGTNGVVAKYPVGMSVTVYYDPDNPRKAILEKPTTGSLIVPGILVGTVVVSLLFAVAGNLRRVIGLRG